ncbi:sensor histidine kinase [Rhodalgimonas zhirmunskyi]|uniref:histidine kinase n=1 Tax=Rhodalgimonas zhirmunskyi TaxID=2964767 RepID=A0AAJ1X6R9_9RHOB|nr:sensor histidine kinase [Rhodoalgimonas zhirmunskyi]MDQ2094974.1 sensor histidine kinase [Rhodoalgimonas zhirmunskyi]
MITRLKLKSQSLTFRIALLLALALLPIGLISVNQTYLLLGETERREQNALMAIAAEAAVVEAGYMQKVLGVAQALAVAAPKLRREDPACDAQLREFMNVAEPLSLVGYVSKEGKLICASKGSGTDISDSVTYENMLANPTPQFVPVRDGRVSGATVVVVTVPIFNQDEFDGYVAMSLLHRELVTEARPADLRNDWPIELITFNRDGDILTSHSPAAETEQQLPSNADLRRLVQTGKTVFSGKTVSGEDRIFASVPLIKGQVFALASWQFQKHSLLRDGINFTNSMFFPLAMWAAGLGVAFFAVQNMVIAPTRNLRARMLMFMRNRQIIPRSDSYMVPLELVEMEETWERLAKSVQHDEAELLNTIHDKTVLVKEVHHRVKNNLQLIASILNMKIRKMKTEDEKRALIDIQQRVMSISRVHQRLYDTTNPERVKAHDLLRSIIGQIVTSMTADMGEMGQLKLTQRYDDVILYPDQAVPVSLAASELVMNALKYVGRPPDGAPWLDVSLERIDEGEALLRIANSVDSTARAAERPANGGDGLGTKLIRAFVTQIEGTFTETTDESSHTVEIRFPIAEFTEESTPATDL